MGLCESKNNQNSIQNPTQTQIIKPLKIQENINNNINSPKINNTPVQSNGQIFIAKPGNNITEQERKIIDAQLAQFLADFDQVSNKDKNAKINFL